MKHSYSIHLFIFLIFVHTSSWGQVQVNILPDQSKHTVSPMIQGHGLIYSHDDDAIFADGQLSQLYKNIGTGFLRWPGGAVTTHFHWNNLNGLGWSDNWEPNYDNSKDTAPANYMDLDEYMLLCKAADTEPMLGINLSSGMEWDRQAEGLQEAVDMINYCINKNFPVRYFYLDNETYHSGNLFNKDPNGDGKSWTASTYAAEFNRYATAIKQLVPDAILIANWSNQIRNNGALKTLISEAGDHIDFIDIHWYWQRGEASWELWKSQTPIQFDNQWYNGGTFVEEINYFRNLTTELGKPHVDIASLEWNIAPGLWQEDATHTKFKTALIQSEMLLQFVLGGLKVGSMWSTQWPGTTDADDRFLVDPDNGYVPNPSAKIFELFKEALNNQVVEGNTEDPSILICPVLKNNNQLIIYLLNKKDTDQNISINIDGYDILSVDRSIRFTDPGILQDITLWQTNNDWRATLKTNTLTMLTLNITKIGPPTIHDNNLINRTNINIRYQQKNGNLAICNAPFIDPFDLTIYSITGARLFHQLLAPTTSNSYSIPIKQLSKGIYVVILSDRMGKRHTKKVIIP